MRLLAGFSQLLSLPFTANVALYLLIDRAPNSTRPSKSSVHWAIALLTFTTVVFRSELVLLLGSLVLQALLRFTSVYDVIKVGLVSGVVSAGRFIFFSASPQSDISHTTALTVVVDSYLWQHWPPRPELYGVYFNVVQGKSSEWGVSRSLKLLDFHLTVQPLGVANPYISHLISPSFCYRLCRSRPLGC